MNDLYLIGNGFDLAHGLKTSYNDFLYWYLNSALSRIWNENFYEDELMKIEKHGNGFNSPKVFKSVSEIIDWLAKMNYKRDSKHDFFEMIIKNYRDFKWVDIEYEYYVALVNFYKEIELNPQRREQILSRVLRLNLCFDSIKRKLIEYLSNIQILDNQGHKLIENILTQGTGAEGMENGEKLFLYFNYTSTLDLYTKQVYFPKHELVYIHGKIANEDNPIIFGYGDEMDPYYEKIENLNNNEFLRNIKSFGYFRTDNYQRVIRFIEGQGRDFTIKILGHSCGLSDRILLNSIFEHPNCKAIKIYYYQKNETENDYFEKTQEISRHFKATAKGAMRNKIVSFERCCPLLPFIKQN